MLASIVAVLAAAVAASEAPAAPETPSPAPAAAEAPAAKPPAPSGQEKVICRSEVPTGSRLGGHRVCHTFAEWEAMNENARQATSSLENRAFSAGTPGR